MIAKVIVDVLNSEVDRVFDYIIPETLLVNIGDMVTVSFGNRKIDGYVLSFAEQSDFEADKLKEILSVKFQRIILPEMIEIMFQMKNIYHLRYVDIIRLIIPTELRDGKVKSKIKKYIHLADDNVVNDFISSLNKNSKNPALIINYLKTVGEGEYKVLTNKYSSAVIKKMLDKGVLILREEIVARESGNIISANKKNITLLPGQVNAINKITNSKFKTFLLHGVTGSGKTEVYLNVIENILKSEKTAIVLVPEISLTPQVVGIFKARFNNIVAVIHSRLSAGEKYDEWKRIYDGEAKIVIGARSAIFSPMTNLGAIIIDEEHDNSYFSDSNPRYSAIEVATMRAKYNDCPLVLGSATPSVDSYYLAQTKEYELLELTKRANNKEMPTIQIEDMCGEFRSGNTTPFSKELLNQLNQTIKDNHQAILFINRRGFSSFLMCRDCGYIPKCEDCDVSLVFHKTENEMKCHYCGKRYRVLTKCPSCGSDNIKLGGVGTERVVEYLKELFPSVKIFRMDNDTTNGKNGHAKIINEFSQTKPAILVGTQMVAKGHDFAEVNLVGILDADLSLFFNDYKASEKTFQLITQVAGRAGRSELEGKVILQTYFPKNYVYKLVANYDYKKFFDKEINLRQVSQFPPFSKIVRVLVSSEYEETARVLTRNLYDKFRQLQNEYCDDFIFLQAMKSPITKIKNKHRFQLVLRFKIEKEKEIIDKIFEIVDGENSKKASIFIETNPLNLS